MTYSNTSHINELEATWLDVQERSDCHYFLTWNWFGSWLKQVKQPFYVLQANINNQVVGLAVIFEKKRKVMRVSSKTQWWLNRTGDDAFDQPWIEYNDFLVDKQYKIEVSNALISFISKQDKWSEFVAGMITNETEISLNKLRHNKRYIIKDYGYQVTLGDIKSSFKSEVLSRNTRQKVNQTHRLLAGLGCVNFSVLTTQTEKLRALKFISSFHINKWKGTVTPSGFENLTFSNCFESQLKSACSEVSELTLNDKPVGYLINYVYRERVYFYLSALSDEFDGKVKLGLYLHSLAIEHYREKNMMFYDFLAGESVYKKSLSNSTYTHNMCCFSKGSPVIYVENLLRKLKQRVG
jgi:CelD/BcsL family acetyltransferase involved in cellulose biosynthesis